MAITKQQMKTIAGIGAFLAFIMLGYLGIRNYKASVEKLKINNCIKEISQLVINIKDAYINERSYKDLDYKTAVNMKLIPPNMITKGRGEAVNSYLGGIDIFYSSLSKNNEDQAFEISFQGLSSTGCKELMKIDFNKDGGNMLIAVGGYSKATPAGVLSEIYSETKSRDIKSNNIFIYPDIKYASQTQVSNACSCKDNTCSVVWKFQ